MNQLLIGFSLRQMHSLNHNQFRCPQTSVCYKLRPGSRPNVLIDSFKRAIKLFDKFEAKINFNLQISIYKN